MMASSQRLTRAAIKKKCDAAHSLGGPRWRYAMRCDAMETRRELVAAAVGALAATSHKQPTLMHGMHAPRFSRSLPLQIESESQNQRDQQTEE